MPKNPYASETSPDTDDPEMTAPPAETVPETTEAVTEITEPPVETETTTVPEQPLSGDVLTADQTDYPLGVSVSVLSRNAQPDETLTVQYQEGNIIFAVYAAEPKKTMIAFAHSDDIFGYYIFCSEYTAPAGYEVTEMRDKQQDDKLYAVLVQKDGLSIAFPNLANGNETQVLSKLAYYATNGIRAINGLDGYIWDEELAKAAMLHSKDMAENDFCAHNSSDGTKFSDRLLNFGIDWQSCAENVDYGYLDPFSAVNGWYNSTSGHRKNLLHTDYQRIGIAFAYNSESAHHYYGTQDFYRGWE